MWISQAWLMQTFIRLCHPTCLMSHWLIDQSFWSSINQWRGIWWQTRIVVLTVFIICQINWFLSVLLQFQCHWSWLLYPPFYRSINQSIHQSVNQPINQSINQTINQSILPMIVFIIFCPYQSTVEVWSFTLGTQPLREFVIQSQSRCYYFNKCYNHINQSINQSINQFISRSISRSINRSINQWPLSAYQTTVVRIDWLKDRISDNRKISSAANQSINQSISQSVLNQSSINQSFNQSSLTLMIQ